MIAAFHSSPLWAIRPEALGQLARLAATPMVSSAQATVPRIAVVPVMGVLTKDGPAWLGSSYDAITAAVEKAASDPDVKRIVLSVDSPGGHIIGLTEAASVIADAAKEKPLSAIVTGAAASAAYWLASQARDITLTPSGEVGSVGVRMAHIDFTKALEQDGVKVTELYSGEFKTEWSPYQPLSDEAKENMQTRLDATRQEFVNAVASGRGMRAHAMHAGGFGGGRMFSADEALKNGLVDNLQSPRSFFRAVLPPQTTTRRMRAATEIARARMN